MARRKKNPALSRGIAAVGLVGGALALGTAIYMSQAEAAPAKKTTTRRPRGIPTPPSEICDENMTEEQAKALGESIKPELDAWEQANPAPPANDHDGWKTWTEAFATKAFSLMGPCGRVRTDFARDFRRGYLMAWMWALAASGAVDEEPQDIVNWFQQHPTYDPLDGMPWEVDEAGVEALMPPSVPLEMAPTPSLGARVGAIAAGM